MAKSEIGDLQLRGIMTWSIQVDIILPFALVHIRIAETAALVVDSMTQKYQRFNFDN